jgi:hypothetical protein
MKSLKFREQVVTRIRFQDMQHFPPIVQNPRGELNRLLFEHCDQIHSKTVEKQILSQNRGCRRFNSESIDAGVV